jgi:hypothetical protein
LRLWSLHPKYLDPQGLVALWREALLARAVLRGETKGYKHHPQLQRFQSHASPRQAISSYLGGVHAEATERGYAFDRTKVGAQRRVPRIRVTRGQLEYEWEHLLRKLKARNPEYYRKWRSVAAPACHPLLQIRPGGIEDWERAGRLSIRVEPVRLVDEALTQEISHG